MGAIFNSIAEIAGGNIGKAIAAVENALAKALPVSISFLAILVVIGGIAAKIKEIIRKIRKPIEKVVGKAVGLVAGKAKRLIAKMTGGDKPKEKPPLNQAEHDAQVKAGLAAIDEEEKKYLEDKQISRENAEKVADTVKKANPIFKSIRVVNGGETWDYEYIASPRRIKRSHYGKLVLSWQIHHVIPKRFSGHPLFRIINFNVSKMGLNPSAFSRNL